MASTFITAMAKNLFEIVQSLLLLAPLLAIVCANALRSEDRKLRIFFLRFLSVLFVLVLLLAYLRDRRIIKYKQINNIYLLVASFIFGLLYCIFTWITSLRKCPETEASVPKEKGFAYLVASLGLVFVGCLLCYRLPTIIVLPFHFVGKDDSYFSTDFLLRMTGFLGAFLILWLIFLSVFKILLQVKKKRLAFVLTLFFLLNAFTSFVGVIGIINSYYRKRIKIPKGLRTKLPQLIQAESFTFFIALVFLLVLALVFIIYNIHIHAEYANPAEHRRLKAYARNGRRWGAFLFALSIAVWLDLTLVKKQANRIVELSPSEEFQLEGNQIFIPLTQISDGHLHRFTWSNGKGKDVRFIIVQKKGTNFGVGFDACEICGNVGYYERKNEIVCNRCDVVMNISTIGLKGGCNPIPLPSKIENGGIIILTDDLDKEAKLF